VVSLGSTLREQREVDAVTMERAVRTVADMPQEVRHDTGDAIAAVGAGIDVAEKSIALADLVGGPFSSKRKRHCALQVGGLGATGGGHC